jgi:hypothetical protein
MSVKDDVALNIHALDEEWEKQSTLMEHYSSSLSMANKEYAELKLVLDGMIAEQKVEWRSEGEIHIQGVGRMKITEGALDNAIDSLESIQEKRQQLIDKGYEVDTLKGIVEALRHKKSALEKEVDLYIAGYYSSPKDQRNLLNKK